jgi:hypothetical protein
MTNDGSDSQLPVPVLEEEYRSSDERRTQNAMGSVEHGEQQPRTQTTAITILACPIPCRSSQNRLDGNSWIQHPFIPSLPCRCPNSVFILTSWIVKYLVTLVTMAIMLVFMFWTIFLRFSLMADQTDQYEFRSLLVGVKFIPLSCLINRSLDICPFFHRIVINVS